MSTPMMPRAADATCGVPAPRSYDFGCAFARGHAEHFRRGTQFFDHGNPHEGVWWTDDQIGRECPDTGTCHHACPIEAVCWRTRHAGPLSGVYPNDQWPGELAQTPPTGNPPTLPTPTDQPRRVTEIHDTIADELITRFGGILRCETCGRTEPLSGDVIAQALRSGWPKCEDLNAAFDHGTMRWWTRTQIDAGELPEIWRRGDVILDDTGNMFAYHPVHGWYGLISNQVSARADTEPAWPFTLLVRDKRPVT
jgi:hypothetical protein